MQINPVSKQRQATLGATHQVRITHEDLTQTAANTAQTFTIPVAARTLAAVVVTNLVVPFKDASDAAFNSNALIIGDGGDTDRLLTSQQLNENGTEILAQAGVLAGYAYNVADTIDITIASMAEKSLSDIDTGELVVYLKLVPLV